jgi:mono/diheme cytochrome c family protein
MRALIRLMTLLALSAGTHCWASDDTGQRVFKARCIVCHQEDAHGAAGVAPSLVGTLVPFSRSAEGRRYLARILVSGMVGPIETEGHKFSGLMPSLAADLSDPEIAATINYVLMTYNGLHEADAALISSQDIAVVRATNPVPTGTRALRQSLVGR